MEPASACAGTISLLRSSFPFSTVAIRPNRERPTGGTLPTHLHAEKRSTILSGRENWHDRHDRLMRAHDGHLLDRRFLPPPVWNGPIRRIQGSDSTHSTEVGRSFTLAARPVHLYRGTAV